MNAILRNNLNPGLINKGKTFDEHGIIANITHLIVQLNDENAKKFEEKFENIVANFKKVEKFEENFKNIDGNLKNIEGNVKNIEVGLSLNKSEKCEEKLNKMELILVQLKNASDVRGGVTSLCACAVNATAMPVKVNAEPTDILNKTKALNACDPNPCVLGGRCLPSSTGCKFKCDCPKFTSGNHCENDECVAENRCYRFKDTLYEVIETKLGWYEAKGNCESLNMTLAMPKDEERTLFLWNRLVPIYKETFVALWIGLKRDEGMRKGIWEWVDGSALGEYRGGSKYMKTETSSLFVLLYLIYGDGHQRFTSTSPKGQYYSICETRRLFAY